MVLFFCLTTLQNWQNCPAALTNHSGFLSIQLGFFRTSRGGANKCCRRQENKKRRYADKPRHSAVFWRRRWDSNPRAHLWTKRFRVLSPSVTYMVSPVSFSQPCTPANPHEIGTFRKNRPKILRNRPSVPISDFSAFGKNCGKNGKNKNQ